MRIAARPRMSASPLSCRGFRERRALEHRAQAYDRPLFMRAAERPRKVALAARHRWRRVAAELPFREAPEAEHLIHQQAGRNFAVVHHHDPRVAWGRSPPDTEELAQVYDRQELSAYVGEPADPGLRTRHAGGACRDTEHFTGLFARHQVQVPRHAQRHTDPLAPGGRLLTRLRGYRAPAPLELREQLEGPVAQGLHLNFGCARDFAHA